MEITHKIDLDFLKRSMPPQIDAVQNDQNSRVVNIRLYAGGVPWEIPSGVSAVIRYGKPDNTSGLYDTMPDGSKAWGASGNILTVRLAPQVLTVPGVVMVSAALVSDANVLGTFAFRVNVESDPANGDVISSDYYKYSTLSSINNAISALDAEMVKTVKTVNGVVPDESGNVNTPGAGTGGEVVSVNGKNGIVVLGAKDVGARPDTWTPTAEDVGAWPDTAVPENGSVVGSDEEDAQGWYDAGVIGPLNPKDDVSAIIAVQHLYDNRSGILSVRVRRQTDGTYYGRCRIISGYMLDPSWYYISVDGDGVAHLIVWINERYDHAKLTVLAQQDRAVNSPWQHRWDMISSGTKITKPEVTIPCALNTPIVDAGVAEITIETANKFSSVYVGFKAGFTSAPAVVTAVTDGSPGAQVSSATVTEKGCWIYAVKGATGTVKVAWTAVQA